MGKEGLIHEDLSYLIRGILFQVRNLYGPGHKEIVYCNAIEELLKINNLDYKREESIRVCSPISGKAIGFYRPDFIISGIILLEVKAVDAVPRNFIDQLYSYLKVSEFELGLFVNFRSPNIYIKRLIYTNNRKHLRSIS